MSLVGKYNFHTCMDVHIPSMGPQRICDRLHDRLTAFEFQSIIYHRFEHLVMNAMHSLVYWRDHPSRRLSSFTVGAQRNIWNAYCMATWDKDILRNARLDGLYIKYHKAEDYVPPELDQDHLLRDETRSQTDTWDQPVDPDSLFVPPRVRWW